MTEFVTVSEGKRWKPGERAFEVNLSYNDTRGTQLYLPQPIVEKWGRPDRLIFTLAGDRVIVTKAK